MRCAVEQALAFEVERYYTGLEALLVRLLGEFDGEVPEGPRRHQQILHAAVLAPEPCRPALVPPEIEGDLRELMGFRHLARHAYEVEPDPERMLLHASRLQRVQAGIEGSLRPLAARLRREAGLA